MKKHQRQELKTPRERTVEPEDDLPGRRNPLPEAQARGHIIVSESVVHQTLTALRGFSGPDGRHEGIVFWAGRREDNDHLVTSAVVPAALHGIGFVHVPAAAVGRAARQARASRLAILAQIHSHPGAWTDHSDGDDRMVLLPYENMFSIVVARYGDGGITAIEGAGIHQYQEGSWVKVTNPDDALIVAPVLSWP